jgi:PilZ domain
MGGAQDICRRDAGARVLRTLLSASRPKAANPALVSEVHKEPGARRFGEQRRAQRFAILTPLRYRAPDGEWQEGMIVNISESGVLFQTDQPAPSYREIEMRFSLPTGVAGETAAQVTCRGRIARVVSQLEMPAAVAARIAKFHFARPDRLPNA